MYKANYFLICEDIIRDKDNKISIISIFDAIGGEQLPIVPERFNIVFSLKAGDNATKKATSFKLKVEIIDTQEKIIAKIEGNSTLEEKVDMNKVSNIVSNINLGGRVPFSNTGLHVLRLYVNDELVGENFIDVKLGDKNEH